MLFVGFNAGPDDPPATPVGGGGGAGSQGGWIEDRILDALSVPGVRDVQIAV